MRNGNIFLTAVVLWLCFSGLALAEQLPAKIFTDLIDARWRLHA